MTDSEEALKVFDDGCMGEHIHEWCEGADMMQARSGVYGFEFNVEQIDTIRQALQAKEPEQVNMEIIKDIIYGFGWCNNAVEEINRLYPNGIIIKDGE